MVQLSADPALGTLGKSGSGLNVGKPARDGRPLRARQAGDHPTARGASTPGEGVGVALIGPEAGLEVAQNCLVQSGGVPGGIFGLHKQKMSPTGDAFSYFLSGRQQPGSQFNAPLF